MKGPAAQSLGITALVLLLFLTACSGGSDSSVASSDGGIEGTGAPVASAGAISSFGSVFVNGIEYDTNTADIIIDDETAQPESALKLGMLVLVRGTRSSSELTGNATSITFETKLIGPASSVAITEESGSLTILGVNVLITEETVIDAATLATLNNGQVLSISGFSLDNDIVATRIDLLSDDYTDGERLEFEGEIAELDSSNLRFRINTQWVDYSAATILPASLENLELGQLVDVRGNGFDSGNRLLATRIKVKVSEFNFEAGDAVELEGIVSNYVSIADFSLAGTNIDASEAEFKKGTASDINNGVHLEVEGVIDSEGRLQASKVVVKNSPTVRLRGSAQSINTSNGTLEILGAQIAVDSTTLLKDVSDAHLKYFSLADINAGDWIEVRGTTDANTVNASSLTRRKSNVPARIKGTISEVTGTDVTVLGISIDLSSLTEGGSLVAALEVGDVIDVTGEEVGSGSLQANTLSLADD